MMSRCHFVITWADQIMKWFHGAVLLPLPQLSQSRWESLKSILLMYISWLIGIYIFEKWHLGEVHLPVLSWVSPMSLERLGQLGSFFELFEGFSWQGGQEETTCHIVVWRPVPLKDLSSNLWRPFSPKWVVACTELTNFHWRFPGRKRSPSFWNHPVWSSWKPSLLVLRVSPSIYEGVSGKLVCELRWQPLLGHCSVMLLS